MAISFPLAAKGLTGLAAIGAPVTTGIYYKNEVADILFSKSQSEQINEKLKELGITDNKCKFLESDKSKECNLNKSELSNLKFSAKTLNVSEEENSDLVKLKIELISSGDSSDISEKLKFTFLDIKQNITIGSDGNQIFLKKNTNPEFKLNSEKNKLEKAWTIEKLSEKIGLKCPKERGSDRCILETGKKINFKHGDKKVTDATFKLNKGELAFEKDQEGYNQGFKFTIGSEFDITLSKDGSMSPDPDKIEKTNSSYEIIEYENIWYLSKVKH